MRAPPDCTGSCVSIRRQREPRANRRSEREARCDHGQISQTKELAFPHVCGTGTEWTAVPHGLVSVRAAGGDVDTQLEPWRPNCARECHALHCEQTPRVDLAAGVLSVLVRERPIEGERSALSPYSCADRAAIICSDLTLNPESRLRSSFRCCGTRASTRTRPTGGFVISSPTAASLAADRRTPRAAVSRAQSGHRLRHLAFHAAIPCMSCVFRNSS